METIKRIVGKTDYLGRPRVQTVNDEPSETVQSDAHLTDMNLIMKQWAGHGQDMLDETELLYADVSEFTDLADALNQARVAERDFMRLPAGVRVIFDNDVANWLDSAHDEEKRDELVKAGFLEARIQDGDAGDPEVIPQGGASSGTGGTGGGDQEASASQ